MHPSWRRLLSKHQGKTLVELCRRPKIQEHIAGFIVAFSDTLILLHRLDWDTFTLNGYTLLREDHVEKHRFFASDSYWQSKAVKKFKLRPRIPAPLPLDNLIETITEISRRYPLIHMEREIVHPDECHICIPLKITKKNLILDNLDTNAEWNGPWTFKLEDITRIDFGGGYERALAATAQKRRAKILKKYRPLYSPPSLVKALRTLQGLELHRTDQKQN